MQVAWSQDHQIMHNNIEISTKRRLIRKQFTKMSVRSRWSVISLVSASQHVTNPMATPATGAVIGTPNDITHTTPVHNTTYAWMTWSALNKTRFFRTYGLRAQWLELDLWSKVSGLVLVRHAVVADGLMIGEVTGSNLTPCNAEYGPRQAAQACDSGNKQYNLEPTPAAR